MNFITAILYTKVSLTVNGVAHLKDYISISLIRSFNKIIAKVLSIGSEL